MTMCELDARGHRCPAPVIMAARHVRDHPGCTGVCVLATDPAARFDVPAWARMRGYRVVSSDLEQPPAGEADAAVVRVVVAVSGTVPEAAPAALP